MNASLLSLCMDYWHGITLGWVGRSTCVMFLMCGAPKGDNLRATVGLPSPPTESGRLAPWVGVGYYHLLTTSVWWCRPQWAMRFRWWLAGAHGGQNKVNYYS